MLDLPAYLRDVPLDALMMSAWCGNPVSRDIVAAALNLTRNETMNGGTYHFAKRYMRGTLDGFEESDDYITWTPVSRAAAHGPLCACDKCREWYAMTDEAKREAIKRDVRQGIYEQVDGLKGGESYRKTASEVIEQAFQRTRETSEPLRVHAKAVRVWPEDVRVEPVPVRDVQLNEADLMREYNTVPGRIERGSAMERRENHARKDVETTPDFYAQAEAQVANDRAREVAALADKLRAEWLRLHLGSSDANFEFKKGVVWVSGHLNANDLRLLAGELDRLALDAKRR